MTKEKENAKNLENNIRVSKREKENNENMIKQLQKKELKLSQDKKISENKWKAEVKKLKSDLGDLDAKLKSSEDQYQADIRRLTSDLELEKNKNANFDRAVKEEVGKVSHLMQDISVLNAEIEQYRASTCEKEHSESKLISEKESAIAKLDENALGKKNLNIQLEMKTKELESLTLKITSLVSEKESLLMHLDQLVIDNKELEIKLGMKEKEYSTVTSEMTTFISERTSLQAKFDKLGIENSRLKSEVQRLVIFINELRNEIKRKNVQMPLPKQSLHAQYVTNNDYNLDLALLISAQQSRFGINMLDEFDIDDRRLLFYMDKGCSQEEAIVYAFEANYGKIDGMDALAALTSAKVEKKVSPSASNRRQSFNSQPVKKISTDELDSISSLSIESRRQSLFRTNISHTSSASPKNTNTTKKSPDMVYISPLGKSLSPKSSTTDSGSTGNLTGSVSNNTTTDSGGSNSKRRETLVSRLFSSGKKK